MKFKQIFGKLGYVSAIYIKTPLLNLVVDMGYCDVCICIGVVLQVSVRMSLGRSS